MGYYTLQQAHDIVYGVLADRGQEAGTTDATPLAQLLYNNEQSKWALWALVDAKMMPGHKMDNSVIQNWNTVGDVVQSVEQQA